MAGKRILVVDDEKNIRLTLTHALAPEGYVVSSAINGEEALHMLDASPFDLMLLDLKMPGMDGMEVLRLAREQFPDLAVVIITAHGTVESAVEAMKLGAVDFIQKPFAPGEIRDLVAAVLARDAMQAARAGDYASQMEMARKLVMKRRPDAAISHARAAISADASRPEAFNLLGALLEITGRKAEALRNYRAALALDPAYAPARANLERATTAGGRGGIVLGEGPAEPEG
jgi:DNA-binding NtrC family response regulator